MISAANLSFRFSAPDAVAGNAASQANPNASLGGFLSTTVWTGLAVNDMFANVTSNTMQGSKIHRCLFLCNQHETQPFLDTSLTIVDQPQDSLLLVGVDVRPASMFAATQQQAAMTLNEQEPPASVLFSSNTTAVGNIPPLSCRAVWLRLLPQAAESVTADSAAIKFQGRRTPYYGEFSYGAGELYGGTANGTGLEQSASWFTEAIKAKPVADSCGGPVCIGAFSNVQVRFAVDGGTEVSWTLLPEYAEDADSATFTLQVGDTGIATASDWKTVASGTNVFSLVDGERRAFGKQLVVHYRVLLTLPGGTVFSSKPTAAGAVLTAHDWGLVNETFRQEQLRLKLGPNGIPGFLLKKKRQGVPCRRCLDPVTGDVLDGSCPVCFGTRWEGGYFAAVPCVHVGMQERLLFEDHSRDNDPSGWAMSTAVKVDCLAQPMLATGDVWVDGKSDLRYYIDEVTVLKHHRGLPTLLNANFRQLGFSDIVYKIALHA